MSLYAEYLNFPCTVETQHLCLFNIYIFETPDLQSMNIFPTQYSTLSSAALRDFLAMRFGLSNCTCRLLIRNVSDTYLVEDDKARYVFKIYRDAHRKRDEIMGEVELLNILKSNGAKVSYPIADREGNYLQAFNAAEGTRYGVLFSYAIGKVYYNLTDSQLAVLGKEMAWLHNISINLKHKRIKFNIDTTINQPLEVIKPAFSDLPEEYNYLLTEGQRVAPKIQTIDFENFSYGYCQYDFLPKNFHFDENDNITFFDFDFAGKGYLINDITSFYIHYFIEVQRNKLSKEEANQRFNIFTESYRKVRPLSDAELQAMPYFGFGFWMFYLGFQYENFEDWSNFFFTPAYLKERTALIKKWMEFFD